MRKNIPSGDILVYSGIVYCVAVIDVQRARVRSAGLYMLVMEVWNKYVNLFIH